MKLAKLNEIEGKMQARRGVASFITTLAVAAIAGLAPPEAHAQLAPGDILVIDFEAGTNGGGALFRVDPVTGNRTVISDFGNAAQGTPLGVSPHGVAIENANSVLVIDDGGPGAPGILFQVDVATGNRTVVSDFGNGGQGPASDIPRNLAIETSGNVLVTDHNAGTASRGALFRVNRATGQREILHDFGGPGPLAVNPLGVAIEGSGNVLVQDFDAGTNAAGILFRVDLATGFRSVVSDFGAGSPTGTQAGFVTLDASGNALVTDFDAGGLNTPGALFRVNTTNGTREVLSDFADLGQGQPIGVNADGLDVDAAGNILVVDEDAGQTAPTGRGILFSVNPSNGVRTVISDFGNRAQGERGIEPSGVAIVAGSAPPPSGPTCSGRAPTSGCTVNSIAGQTCQGTNGDDTIVGTSGADVILGLAGNDTIIGGAGADLICGGDGNDIVRGSLGPDQLLGEAGDDEIRAGRGADSLDGGDGTDTCFGGLGSKDGASNCETTTGVP